ncbi:hypothetical protein PYW07_000746 [Mythimna separata]|uniref:BTB domain-containing protein n=1 Tax=Mythimna separata TaxID=271217 RepID=A0AAD7YQY3_MYTSE|nr:hypothetical protein PYW07_000746 [Mythimna separata]
MAGVPSDWQLGCVEVKQRGEYLLKSGQWSDCTFLVGAEPDQVVIAGHKLVLAMASPVFEAMFYGGMAERNDPIPILDVQPEAFRALLEYIYTDNINISSFDKACELCYGAKKYMLPHLVKECTRYLWSDLYPRNACRAYEFARLFEENVLMDKCIQIISTNTKEVLTDSSFEDVELNTVITVFSLDHLNVDSELDLFEAAVRYAKAQDKRTSERSVSPPSENGPPNEKRSKSPGPSTSKDKVVNVESSAENSPEAVMDTQKTTDSSDQPLPGPSDEGKKKPDPKTDKPTIRSAIEKIRFLTLTPQQFAEGPARSSLLTESEAFAVLMNILSSTSDVAMPSGFSTCRVPRKQLIGNGPSSNMATLTVDTPSPVMLEQVFGAPSAYQPYPRPTRHDVGVRHSSIVHNANLSGLGVPEHMDRHNNDYNKIYCQRPIIQHTDCLNTSVLDCSVTFMVDKNICLLGVQRPIIQHTDCLNTSVLDCSVTFMVDKNICLLGVQRPIIQHTDCLNTSVLDCSVTFMVDKNICLLGVQRPIIQHTDCLNTSVLDCSVTFMVDKNICLLGVQVRHYSTRSTASAPSSSTRTASTPRCWTAPSPSWSAGKTLLYKIYCQRPIIQHTDCLNTSVLDCSVTFMVDKNICLLGVQVPTQAPSEESGVSCALGGGGAGAGSYCELLYAHLLDADGARLTYTHYTNRVPFRHLLDIMFNRPVYIQRNKVYKVGIVFNKVGWYPMGTCAQQVAAESVFFNFGIGQSSDSVRDGLIRSIIFTY